MYLNGAIDWSAKAIKLVPDSSCEAEMAQALRACKAGIAVRMLLRAARRKVIGPTPMLGDNKAYTEIVQQEGASARTRYYERAVLLVKRAVLLLIMSVYSVPHWHRLDVSRYLHEGPRENSVHSAPRGHHEYQWRNPRRPRAINGGNERIGEAHDFEAMRQAWMVDAVRLGGSVESEPVTCMGVCVCAHGGTWVGTLPLRRGSAALGGARRVERSGLYYLPYTGGDPA